jgi:hypothetical protein
VTVTAAQVAALRAHVARWSGGFSELQRELLHTVDALDALRIDKERRERYDRTVGPWEAE